MIVLSLQIGEVLLAKNDDLFEFSWAMVKLSTIFVSGMKVFIIIHSKKAIESLRNFIISDRVFSGDDSYDVIQEKKYKQTARTALRVTYCIIIIDIVLLTIPYAGSESFLELPSLFISFGKHFKQISRFFAVSLLSLGFLPRILSSIIYIGTLFMGMRAKYMILAHRYGLILHRYSQNPDADFEIMNSELQDALTQELEFLRFLNTDSIQHIRFNSFPITAISRY